MPKWLFVVLKNLVPSGIGFSLRTSLMQEFPHNVGISVNTDHFMTTGGQGGGLISSYFYLFLKAIRA